MNDRRIALDWLFLWAENRVIDEQLGSTALCDIALLQALSRRFQYGKFVAESRYRSDPNAYQHIVGQGDTDGVMTLLSHEVVEQQVLCHARFKATAYGSVAGRVVTIEGRDFTSTLVAAATPSAVVDTIGALLSAESITVSSILG
jgi:chorismate mutase